MGRASAERLELVTGGRAPKVKGDNFERAVVAVFRAYGIVAERCYGAGRPDDVGDLELDRHPWLIVDCKDAKRHELADWIDSLSAKAEGKLPVVIVKRPRRPVNDAYVVVPLGSFCALLLELELAAIERERGR